jgi:molecular chaperone GrpE (heat shock protein)
MSQVGSGYWRRVIDSVLNRRPEPGSSGPDASPAELRARIASLEMDVADRDQRIAVMREEYAASAQSGLRSADSASGKATEDVVKRLAGALSNAAVLGALAKSGKEVAASDALALLADIERQLGRAGVERIGEVGEEIRFDTAQHQRMSGGTARADSKAVVRMPGYRLGERVLLKAMVSVEGGS